MIAHHYEGNIEGGDIIVSRSLLCLIILGKLLTAQDWDANGIEDHYEQTLANMFSPNLVLNADDQGVSPEPVEIMGIRSQDLWMRVFNLAGQIIMEEQAIAGRQWDPAVGYRIPSLGIDKSYAWFNLDELIYDGRPYSPNDGWLADSKYYLRIHYDWAGPEKNGPTSWRTAYAGEATNNYYKDRIYANLWKRSSTEYVIQYWFFYPFNHAAINHEGDWEHINVVVSNQDPARAYIQYVDFYFHYYVKPGLTDRNQDFYVTDDNGLINDNGTHPVVFVGGYTEVPNLGSGPGGHGSFPVKGTWRQVPIALGSNEIIVTHEQVGGDGRYIPHNSIEVFVLPHYPEKIDYSTSTGKKMSWLKANIPWGHLSVDQNTAWGELFVSVFGSPPPAGPYHWVKGKPRENQAWNNVGNENIRFLTEGQAVGPGFETYDDPLPYWPVTESGWSPPSVQGPPMALILSSVTKLGSQVALRWNNQPGTKGT